MSSVTFGKRGLTRPETRALPRKLAPDDAVSPERAAPDDPLAAFHTGDIFTHLPFLTAGLVLLLAAIFALQKHFAFDMGAGGVMSLSTLIAMGGASYDAVVVNHEFWRIFLTPLLHSSLSHLVGNCIALALVGWQLELRVGRAWYAAIFAVAGLTGVFGSLLGNPHHVTTVGASGAICGLIGAVFIISFHPRCNPLESASMRKWALRLGIPSLGPVLYQASSGVDYNAHLGGALGGALIALLIVSSWRDEQPRPGGAVFARWIAVGGLLAAMISTGFAASHYRDRGAAAADFIPLRDLPKNLDSGLSDSGALLARYPKDPRAHFFQALAYVKSHDRLPAETELRKTMALATRPTDVPVRDLAQTYLAISLAERGVRREAADLARPGCSPKGQPLLRRLLQRMRLCD